MRKVLWYKLTKLVTWDWKILRKCQSKLDCLIFEMLFIRFWSQSSTNRATRSAQNYLFIHEFSLYFVITLAEWVLLTIIVIIFIILKSFTCLWNSFSGSYTSQPLTSNLSLYENAKKGWKTKWKCQIYEAKFLTLKVKNMHYNTLKLA